MNFSDFPLYENLKKEEFKELSEEEKDNLFEKIKSISEEKQEIIYALIKAFYMEENKQFISKDELPYGGKILKQRIKFNLDQIPSKLQYILQSYIKLNI